MAAVYSKLASPSSFRLLELCSGGVHDPVRCQLHCADSKADGSTAYEALSYTWGDATDTKPVTCNEQPLRVTSNLFNALVRLRHPSRSRLLWVDALCINQNDVEERASQVQLMRDIFATAQRVLVWLGMAEAEDRLDDAVALLRVINDAWVEKNSPDARALVGGDDGAGAISLSDLQRHVQGYSVHDAATWEPLASFFRRPWFRRVWCVQEVKVSHRVLVLCDQHELSWDLIGCAALFLNDQQISSDFHGPAYLMDIDCAPAMDMYDELDAADSRLLPVLDHFRDFEATDPRDKIYGLLGMVVSNARLPELEVSYGKSVQESYTSLVLHALRSQRSLYVLSFVSHGPVLDRTFPSWVPRWDVGISATRIASRYENTEVFNACGEHKLEEIPSMIDNGILPLIGWPVDTVNSVFEIMDLNMFDSTAHPVRSHLFLRLFKQYSENVAPESRSSNLLEVLLTATCNLTLEWDVVLDLEPKDRQLQHIADYYAYIQRLVDTDPEEPAMDVGDDMGTAGDWLRFERTASRVCENRRFFLTEHRRISFIGLGPAAVAAGDILAVLRGGVTPFLLRPCGDKFLFLGECFLFDIMSGPADDDLLPKHEETIFNLI